jgi:twitching motility protein PilI
MSRKRNRQNPRKPANAAPKAGGSAVPAAVSLHPVEDDAQEPAEPAAPQMQDEPLQAVEHAAVAEDETAAAAPAPDVAAADPVAAAARVAPRARKRVVDRREPFAILLDYEDRSLRHVAGLPEQIDAPGLWRGVGYRVGSRRLASGFDEVVEILPMPQVTHVPGAQPWMLGVANVRGNLLPIVDLKQFLEGERTVLHEGQRMLVVRQAGGDVAITVDELYGQRSFVEEQRIDTESAEAKPGVALAEGRYAHLIERSYRIDTTTWGVLSLDRLSRTPEFRQAAA